MALTEQLLEGIGFSTKNFRKINRAPTQKKDRLLDNGLGVLGMTAVVSIGGAPILLLNLPESAYGNPRTFPRRVAYGWNDVGNSFRNFGADFKTVTPWVEVTDEEVAFYGHGKHSIASELFRIEKDVGLCVWYDDTLSSPDVEAIEGEDLVARFDPLFYPTKVGERTEQRMALVTRLAESLEDVRHLSFNPHYGFKRGQRKEYIERTSRRRLYNALAEIVS